MSSTVQALVSIAMLPKILEAAQLLASEGVIKPEDVNKCVRVFISKHPEINEHLAKPHLPHR